MTKARKWIGNYCRSILAGPIKIFNSFVESHLADELPEYFKEKAGPLPKAIETPSHSLTLPEALNISALWMETPDGITSAISIRKMNTFSPKFASLEFITSSFTLNRYIYTIHPRFKNTKSLKLFWASQKDSPVIIKDMSKHFRITVKAIHLLLRVEVQFFVTASKQSVWMFLKIYVPGFKHLSPDVQLNSTTRRCWTHRTFPRTRKTCTRASSLRHFLRVCQREQKKRLAFPRNILKWK